MALVNDDQPFTYVSGKYASEFEKATVAIRLCDAPKKQGVFVYDLRHDPSIYASMSVEQLVEAWRWKKDSETLRLPVKTLAFNKCPAVAPLGVLDAATRQRLQIDLATIKKHAVMLKTMKDFPEKLRKAAEILDQQFQTSLLADDRHVDGQLYDGFIPDHDKQIMRVVRAAKPDELGALVEDLSDKRLQTLLPLYKARNFPRTLTSDEREAWDAFCKKRLLSGGQQSRMAKYLARLQDITAKGDLTGHQQYLLEELKLYAESIMPSDDL